MGIFDKKTDRTDEILKALADLTKKVDDLDTRLDIQAAHAEHTVATFHKLLREVSKLGQPESEPETKHVREKRVSRKGQPYTKEDDAFIAANWRELTHKQIARKLGRTHKAVAMYCLKNGYVRTKKDKQPSNGALSSAKWDNFARA